MTPVQKQQIVTEALPCVEPLRAALDALPGQDSQDSLVRQCLDAGRSLCEWTTRLAKESPVAGTGEPIPFETLHHVAMVGMAAAAGANKLMTKETEAKLQAQYKWVRDLSEFIQAVFNALAWDYQPS